jgi:hypothetical protein
MTTEREVKYGSPPAMESEKGSGAVYKFTERSIRDVHREDEKNTDFICTCSIKPFHLQPITTNRTISIQGAR